MLLNLLVGVPLVGGVVVACLPRRAHAAASRLALLLALITLGLGVAVWSGYDTSGADPVQLAVRADWIPAIGASWSLGVTGISLALVLLTVVATPIVLAAMAREVDPEEQSVPVYHGLTLITAGLCLVAFLARDLLLFYIAFEAMLIPMYFIIGLFGGPNRTYAAVRFVLFNLFGGLAMLAGLIWLYLQTPADGRTFDLTALAQLGLSSQTQTAIFAAFMLAFAIKAPLWPFHTWLPDAADQAPHSQAAFLSGVVDKVGTFGMLAICLPLFPDAVEQWSPVLVVLAVISLLWGAMVALGQTELKRLIAYTSISHYGVIVLGIFALNMQAASGATFYMVAHGLSTMALFLVSGLVIARGGSRRIDDYRGIQKPAPMLAGAMLLAGLSGLAMPGMATFISEFLVLLGTFQTSQILAVVATTGIVLAALYVLWTYQRTMTGPTNDRTERFTDLRPREWLVLAPLFVLLIGLGFAPRPVLDPIDHGVKATMPSIVSDITPQLAGAEEGQK